MLRYSWLLFALLLFPLSAQARARDDAMSGAYRCAAIGEQRPWLDCYYGAAQPARAALNLSPAPAVQLRLAAAPPPGALAAADAHVRDSVMAGALRCYAVEDERQWLDCYYTAAEPVRAQLGLSPAGQPVIAMVAPAPQFGILPSKAGLPRGANQVIAPMTAYSFSNFHIFTVTLANGQVWRQLSGDPNTAHWNKPAAGYVAIITHGAFGSFNFQVKGLPGIYKVERVQ